MAPSAALLRRFVAGLVLATAALALNRPMAAQSSGLTVPELELRLNRYARVLADWAGLTRYGSENAELPKPKPGEERVVFFGDQITEAWGRAGAFFPGGPYLNRGIGGQTTAQMLVRFRQDVVALTPKAVVVQGGGNDIASLFTPGTEGLVLDNVRS